MSKENPLRMFYEPSQAPPLTFVDHLAGVRQVFLRQHRGERHAAAQPLLGVHRAEQGHRGSC